jgi:hypothetical protein
MRTQLKEYRDAWTVNQRALRSALESGEQREKAVELFMVQQGVLHSSKAAPEAPYSLEDLLLDDISDEIFRRVPKGEEHSIAWLMWHLARCEDITMNVLAAGRPQVVEKWQAKLKIDAKDTGNAMTHTEIGKLSERIDLAALRGYRAAVGRVTREIVVALTLEEINARVAPERIEKILDEGMVLPAAVGIAEYWGRRTIAGLMLMPPTRHNMTHINEGFRLKAKRA